MCVFFFKQKTAYEMRISDWSSDVCSSDLVSRLAAMRAGNEGDYLFMLLYAGFVGCGLFALWRELRSRVLFAAIALPVAAALCDAWENTQIGRASCRDRVCQYV